MPWESRGHLVILAEAVTVKRQARGAPTVITMTTRPQSRPQRISRSTRRGHRGALLLARRRTGITCPARLGPGFGEVAVEGQVTEPGQRGGRDERRGQPRRVEHE
jgi:hypothetical protein